MKKQILTLLTGILIGAIITTGVFLVLKGNTQSQNGRMNRENGMEMGEPPSMDGNTINGEKGNSRPNNKETQNTTNSENTNTTDSDI